MVFRQKVGQKIKLEKLGIGWFKQVSILEGFTVLFMTVLRITHSSSPKPNQCDYNAIFGDIGLEN